MGELHEAACGAIALWRALDQPFGAIPHLLTAARSCAENVDGAQPLRTCRGQHASTCRRTPRSEAPEWRCRQQQSRGCYCLLILAWSCRSPTGRGCGETASIRAFDCLNPRLLSAQPWELLFALSQPSCLVCCLPAPGLMMSKLQELDGLRAIPTIVESLWGWQRRPLPGQPKHGLLGAPGFHVCAPRSFQGLGARRTLPFSNLLRHYPACRRSNEAGWSFSCVHWARSGLWALPRCLLVFCRLHPSQLWT